MKHLRSDYNAIQPWPTKRPHIVKVDGHAVDVEDNVRTLGKHMDPLIPDDEPVFLLRAKDRFAPQLVRDWAQMLYRAARKELDAPAVELGAGSTPEYDDAMALAGQVEDWADQMEDYAALHYHGGDIPDTPREFLP